MIFLNIHLLNNSLCPFFCIMFHSVFWVFFKRFATYGFCHPCFLIIFVLYSFVLYRTLKVKIVQHTSKRRISQRYRNEKMKNILFEIIKDWWYLYLIYITFLLIKGSSKISCNVTEFRWWAFEFKSTYVNLNCSVSIHSCNSSGCVRREII